MSGCPLLNNSGYLFDIRGRISFIFFYIVCSRTGWICLEDLDNGSETAEDTESDL